MNQIPNQTGVYAIIFKGNNRMLICSARNMGEQMIGQRSQLRRGVHKNRSLQHDFNDYGEEMFEVIVLEKMDDASEMTHTEKKQQWLDRVENKYNLCLVAGSTTGTKRTISQREKMGAWQVGRKLPSSTSAKLSVHKRGEGNPKAKLSDDDVYRIHRLLSLGVGVSELARMYGVNRSTIYNVKGGKTWKHLV